MRRRFRWLVLIVVAAVIAAPIAACGTGYLAFNQWRPVIRDGSYRELLREFKNASAVSQQSTSDGSTGWDFDVPLSNGVRASVRAQAHMAVARVQYSDEPQERELYRYKDYSNPISLRTQGPVLYLYWAESLIGTDHWILAYDLAARRERSRARVVPDDLGIGPDR